MSTQIKDMHPNNVKRINRLRNLSGKKAFYLPKNKALANTDLDAGARVHIINVEVENPDDKMNTLVRVREYYITSKEHSVFLQDLCFPH